MSRDEAQRVCGVFSNVRATCPPSVANPSTPWAGTARVPAPVVISPDPWAGQARAAAPDGQSARSLGTRPAPNRLTWSRDARPGQQCSANRPEETSRLPGFAQMGGTSTTGAPRRALHAQMRGNLTSGAPAPRAPCPGQKGNDQPAGWAWAAAGRCPACRRPGGRVGMPRRSGTPHRYASPARPSGKAEARADGRVGRNGIRCRPGRPVKRAVEGTEERRRRARSIVSRSRRTARSIVSRSPPARTARWPERPAAQRVPPPRTACQSTPIRAPSRRSHAGARPCGQRGLPRP